MKILVLLFLILFSSPSKAITWNQFWRPFKNGGYYPTYYYPRYYNICKREIYREEYVSGNGINEGYIKRWTEVQKYSC